MGSVYRPKPRGDIQAGRAESSRRIREYRTAPGPAVRLGRSAEWRRTYRVLARRPQFFRDHEVQPQLFLRNVRDRTGPCSTLGPQPPTRLATVEAIFSGNPETTCFDDADLTRFAKCEIDARRAD